MDESTQMRIMFEAEDHIPANCPEIGRESWIGQDFWSPGRTTAQNTAGGWWFGRHNVHTQLSASYPFVLD